MKQLIKVNNKELSYRLKLNYNNVYSSLRMMLGKSADLFAVFKAMPAYTTWYADDDADYTPLSEAPRTERRELLANLGQVLNNARTEIGKSDELAQFADDILEVPDEYKYIFYRRFDDGTCKFVLTGWGCKTAHSGVSESGSLIKRVSGSTVADDEPSGGVAKKKDIPGGKTVVTPPFERESGKTDHDVDGPLEDPAGGHETGKSGTVDTPEQPGGNTPEVHGKPETPETTKKKKEQRVVLKVINQNMKPVEDEDVRIRTVSGEVSGVTDENGIVDAGSLPYHSSFSVSFPNMPNIPERAYEVEPKVEQYDVYIKKYVNYSPVLFVEDQNGNAVPDYNIKVMISGQDKLFNTGSNGMVQLPTIQEGQKFIVIDAANYANSEEYPVTSESVKKPFRFTIRRSMKTKVGITVLDKEHKPLPETTVDIAAGDTPCQQITGDDGRAEFPSEVFQPGEVAVRLYVPGKGNINSKLDYLADTTEYTIQLTGKRSRTHHFNWKWLLLLPLLLLLGFGGKMLYDHLQKKDVPTIAEMETGVVLMYGIGNYYADLNMTDVTVNGKKLQRVWFNYNDKGELTGYTFDRNKAQPLGWTGTGFLISDNGLIATNKHVADPEPDVDLAKFLRNCMQAEKDMYQHLCDSLSDNLRKIGSQYGTNNQLYEATRQNLQRCREQLMYRDAILNTGDFKIGKTVRLFGAFTGTRIEHYDEMIPLSSPRAVGDPGGTNEKDLAIVQISKKQDIPTDAFIFDVPENDLMDEEIPDNYEVTVLGYNAGFSLQTMDHQEAIKPQAQHGRISDKSKMYVIGYDVPTLGGSSGSPVINANGQLVAVNCSGVEVKQGFNYGVRTKFLKELLDGVKNSGQQNTAGTKEMNEKRKRLK